MRQQVMLHANAFICAAACLRLMTYRRGKAEFNRFMAFVAWLLTVAMGAKVIRVVIGGYVYIEWLELMINAVICSMLYRARGNVGHLFKITN